MAKRKLASSGSAGARSAADGQREGKGPPDTSRLTRGTAPLAYARKQPPEAADPAVLVEPVTLWGPRDLPAGDPTAPAPAPGHVPPGDSRSLRRAGSPGGMTEEFALIYRHDTVVIARVGVVGQRGRWRVVEYPTPGAAGHAYARECSRFVAEGFSDYRQHGG
jgi:hypothetical protein